MKAIKEKKFETFSFNVKGLSINDEVKKKMYELKKSLNVFARIQ